jgi:hypothetical protein
MRRKLSGLTGSAHEAKHDGWVDAPGKHGNRGKVGNQGNKDAWAQKNAGPRVKFPLFLSGFNLKWKVPMNFSEIPKFKFH